MIGRLFFCSIFAGAGRVCSTAHINGNCHHPALQFAATAVTFKVLRFIARWNNSYSQQACFLIDGFRAEGPNSIAVCNLSDRAAMRSSHPICHPLNLKVLTMTGSDNIITDPVQARTRLWEMIQDIRFAMFTTRHGNGHLHSRPMTTQNSKLDEDASLWFFMSRAGDPVADIAADPTVNLVYADPDEDTYVSISGTAAVVEDLEKKQQLWTKMAQAWFPGGATDADLALVQVRITHANYWDIDESKIVQLFHMARAAITGKPPTRLGEHAEIRMD